MIIPLEHVHQKSIFSTGAALAILHTTLGHLTSADTVYELVLLNIQAYGFVVSGEGVEDLGVGLRNR
jgi:hypothetical protein